MKRIALNLIAVDAGTQIRAAIDQQVVTDYAEAMTSGAAFPPIVVFHDGNQHYLADGFHRLMAAQRNDWRELDADVRPGTKEDAVWFALGANRTNGKRLNEQDKQHAALIALQMWPMKMQREIAEQVGCSESLVSKVALKDAANNTSGDSGIRGRALVNKVKRDSVRDLVLAGEQSTEIKRRLHVNTELVADVRRELGLSKIDYSRKGVTSRRQQMREMAELGHSSRQIAAELGLTEVGCRKILRDEHINVPADKAVGGTHRHDSNRIVERIVMDAENLTEGMQLIEFTDLDRSRFAEWLNALTTSRDKLGIFIRRLMKEQQKHGEAA